MSVIYDDMEDLYIHEVIVKRNGKVKQPAGNFKEGEIVIYNPMNCRVTTSSAANNEILKREKQNFDPNYKIYAPASYEIKPNDRIYFKDYVFEVKGEPRNPAFMDHHIEIYCEKV
ncbi:hypothetical protein BAMA_15775 [Bacillus manliponensis]|uniref:Uncharacterized protein n=1 Tax=Bacillus manliponensis TaxID=574376 RepID=A0A073JSQ9_9BACI|nr:hypothetical protein [Bacillus manliponensis]KEK17345.1 hypothetical protein BAMA_15775 [Bacillus manliponensis]